jgi:hypothetical protein
VRDAIASRINPTTTLRLAASSEAVGSSSSMTGRGATKPPNIR